MTNTPRAKLRIGDVAVSGFVFRDQNGNLASPTDVSVEIYPPNATAPAETITQGDSRVTIGAALPATLATKLGLTTAQNTAGVGIVRVESVPNSQGYWTVFCQGTATVIGSAKDAFKVLGKTE